MLRFFQTSSSRVAALSEQFAWQRKNAYWLCQCLGWGVWISYGILDDFVWRRWTPETIPGALLIGSTGLFVTHGFRCVARRLGWLSLNLESLFWRVLIGSLATSALWLALVYVANLRLHALKTDDFTLPSWLSICGYSAFLTVGWSVFYFGYQVVRRLSRQQHEAQVDRLRLQTSLAAAELGALRSQVHPHFLFNCLNGLRGLTSEDPIRAREAITRLANLLRYSLRVGAVAMVPLEEELEIVDDYLELEAIRFEKRLRVLRSIDPHAHNFLVPPMAVQTLVENAIKYGVSPFRRPSEISINVSISSGSSLNIRVTNGGGLDRKPAADGNVSIGIGLANLRERLFRLYGSAASLALIQESPGRVVAELFIPAKVDQPNPADSPAMIAASSEPQIGACAAAKMQR